jgi:hypothetical protein
MEIIAIPIALGILEAYLFHYMDLKKYGSENLHNNLVLLRAFIYLSLYNPSIPFAINILWLVASIFVFPFCHNSAYYITRHKLNPLIYTKGLLSKSETSNAKLNFGFPERIILFIIGILLSLYITSKVGII